MACAERPIPRSQSLPRPMDLRECDRAPVTSTTIPRSPSSCPLHEHRVWLEDMPTILRTILSLRYFVIGTRMFAQRRGSPMGNPASPAMCLLVVAAVEESWSHTYAEMLHNNKQLWFSCRYVDNRLTMLTAPLATTPPFRTFLAKEFYIDTITLADEPGNDFLGFSINLNTRSIRHKPPDSPSQFLHPASASPTMVIRSSLDSRKHLARRLAYPQREVQVALQQLRDLWNVTLSHTVLPGYAPTRLISFDKNACFCTFHCLTRQCLIRPPLQHSGLFSLHLRHGR